MDGIKTRWVGLLLFLAAWVQAQSPHGKELSLRCDACHTSASWLVARDSISFNHDSTRFLLEGRHKSVDCRQCHSTLVFSEAETNCASCHLDIHQQTVGQECNRCHTAESWLVNNIAEIHRRTSFPLLGQHAIVECTACHKSESELRFPPIGVECIDCHLSDYQATTKPDHSKAGFSTACSDCHKIDALEWTAGGINHDFFPLTKGHDINDCATCHKNPDYTKISPECITCHETDYMSTAMPNHQSIGIGTDCKSCHTTDPGWKPARYPQHDAQFFPIYHGAHGEAWSECTDCHTNPANFAEFTCVTCHSNPGTDNAHTNVLGYSYHSPACLACHPTGDKNDVFDHNNTNFALTGAHTTVECLSCHTNGFAGTPTDCNACHAKDFDQSLNPNHSQLGLTRDCASCHTTDPDWNPAKFDIHDQFYVLEGAHAKIKNDCNACHNGDYNNTPTTCVGCHQQDYDQSTNPSHTAGHFPTDCALCHNQASWAPTTFDHNTTSFPLLGAHATVNCQACHANGYQGTPTDCVACHQKDYDQSTNPPHAASQFPTDCKLCHTETAWAPATFDHNTTAFPLLGAHATVNCLSCHANGYQGTPTDCVACHQQDYDQSTNPPHATNHYPTDCKLCHSETAWSPSSFDHNATAFQLTGAHITVDCQSCHANGYQGTPTACVACHQPDFNQSSNPSHTNLGLSTDCATCHTTAPGWSPATFDVHNQYYALNGAHALIATQCATCHNGDYINTPNTCIGCHQQDYNQTNDPSHTALQFSTNCVDCHTENAWSPATFDHDGQYFPIYSGKHKNKWNQCADCHTSPGDYSVFTCITCHTLNETNQQHDEVSGYSYNSNACLACHPNGSAEGGFNHNQTNFPLTGAHTALTCVDCHANGYQNTPTECVACHQPDFQNSLNPNHVALNLSTDCATCHTTQPGWAPATFDVHNQFYALNGAHALIGTQCASCHNGDYNNTPNTCVGCHQSNYDQTTNPSHTQLQFTTECTTCHTESAWVPAALPNHNDYYALNGAHALIATQCASCHNGDYNNTPNTCVGCHQANYDQTTNPSHTQLQFTTECTTCHTESAWVPASMPNHNDYYALNGAHALIADQCASCHNGDYNNTPNTCVGCHLSDYNQTTNPNHLAAGFNTDCASCHTETAWVPANFNHDAQYFPIYSGKHQGVWDQCVDCHTNTNDFSVFTCITCHTNPETDNQHQGVNGYAYNSVLCLACHPTGDADSNFDHNSSGFALTGAHLTVACLDCHTNGFQNTPTECVACHQTDYNQSSNPNHIALNLPTDCASCHTTNPNWNPATFSIHNQYYALNGAHALIADQCVTCHNGDYNNTPNTCVGCHQNDYNQTNNPDHQVLQFSTDCATCHTEVAWSPAEYAEHDNQYFPIYTGAHGGTWDQCNDCHTNPNNYSVFTCVTCHTNTETNQQHTGVGGYIYQSAACLACHPTGEAQGSFNHNNSSFPLTGGHQGVDCIECHANGYQNTPTECVACHQTDYNQSSNPSHTSLGLSTDCVTCHTTDPNWDPALFPIHNNYWVFQGAHVAISNDCVLCHNGDYNNTPNTCYGCHQSDYNQTNNPNHLAANFPTTCETCHSQNAWVPANWDHDGLYFPIYSGSHHNVWDQCNDCHTNSNNFAIFTCITCHQQNETNQHHNGVQGYQYNSAACYACHPTGQSD